MPEQKQPRCHKINQSQNDKIVSLIKSKLTPLHKKHQLFPKFLQPIDLNSRHNIRNSTGYIYKEMSICQKHLSYDREIQKQIKDNCLFKKVKNHIEEKKKQLSEQQLQNARQKIPKISLSSYIDLFSKPEQLRHSSSKMQFGKIKRQSLALNVFDNIQNSGVKQNQKCMTEEEVCLMNAKFRKQLNHRKLIGIWKIRNKV